MSSAASPGCATRRRLFPFRARWQCGIALHRTLHGCTLILSVAVLTLCACDAPGQVPDGSLPELDRSLFTHLPCAPPCWSGLVPGVSPQDEVYAVLHNSPWVRKGSVSRVPREGLGPGDSEIVWEDRDVSNGMNRAYVVHFRLVLISIGLDHDQLTLGNVVDMYGPPEAVYARAKLDFFRYTVDLYYLAQGMRFTGIAYPVASEDVLIDSKTGILEPDMSVNAAYYFAPGAYDDALRDAYQLDEERISAVMGALQPWQGFGQVNLCCQ